MFTLTAFLLCSPATFGKTVSGVFKSDAAREQNGQYITKFMYNGRCSSLKLATNSGGRLVCTKIHMHQDDVMRFIIACFI